MCHTFKYWELYSCKPTFILAWSDCCGQHHIVRYSVRDCQKRIVRNWNTVLCTVPALYTSTVRNSELCFVKFVYLHLVVALSSSKISMGISVEQHQSRIGFHDNLSPLTWNVHYGYLFESLKTLYLLFAILLSSVHVRWEAVRTDWIIHSEKFLVVWTASAIRSKTIFIHSNG